jgi:hypothetical protein
VRSIKANLATIDARQSAGLLVNMRSLSFVTAGLADQRARIEIGMVGRRAEGSAYQADLILAGVKAMRLSFPSLAAIFTLGRA